MPRGWRAPCCVDAARDTHSSKSVAERPRSERGEVRWAGFIHSYFLSAAAPEGAKEQSIGCLAHSAGPATGGMAVDLIYPLRDLAENNTLRGQGQIAAYMGPKYLG